MIRERPSSLFFASLDEPVALHALDGVGDRRLLDVEPVDELLLGPTVGAVELQHHGKLCGPEPEMAHALAKALREQPRHVVREVARGTVFPEVHRLQVATS